MISRSFQTVRRMREAWKFGLFFFRPSRQSNISTSCEERFKYPLPWENKISKRPYPRANKDNQIPYHVPGLPPHPPPPPPPAGITLIGALPLMAAILIFKCTEGEGVGDYSSRGRAPRHLSSCDTHARWQPVTQSARSRRSLRENMGL